MPDPLHQGHPNYSILSKASTLCGALLFLTLGGYWLDQKLHTPFICMMIGACLGLLYCCYAAWQMLNSKQDPK